MMEAQSAIPAATPSGDGMVMEQLLASARSATELLKALSHESRLIMLCMLLDGERTVGELEQALGLRQPAVSQQLARLRADGLVEARREGKNIYYSIGRPEVRGIIEALYLAFCKI